VEAQTPEEEILSACEDISAKGGPASGGKDKINFSDCAVLVPKNMQARQALEIIHRAGLPVAVSDSFNFFDQKEGQAFLRILKIIDSGDAPALALSFFDEVSGVSPLLAHEFLASQNMREFSWQALLGRAPSLFGDNAVGKWLAKLAKWKEDAKTGDLKALVENIGKELLHLGIVSGEDLAQTLLTLIEKRTGMTLSRFVFELEKAEEYGEELPLVVKEKSGVKVLTMHSSKGLEFEYVWIAHMDENSLVSGRKRGFTLPLAIAEKVEERDVDSVKRKLYVAITRAKRFCALSYALESHKGSVQEVAKIIADLPEEVFERQKAKIKNKKEEDKSDFSGLTKLVTEKYTDKYISASLLNNFFECAWKWYFRNLLGLPEAPTESLEFGSRVHEAIDQILKSGKLVLPEDKEVANVVSRWAERRLQEISPNRKTEEGISMKNEAGLKIFGKIDLIENLAEGMVRVTDFKTGSPRKKYDIEKLDEEGRMGGNLRQLAMYSYLLQNNSKWRADVR
ncbi:MAG: 3'-5' exonuclease, partial [Patescibacteria group bacterium]